MGNIINVRESERAQIGKRISSEEKLSCELRGTMGETRGGIISIIVASVGYTRARDDADETRVRRFQRMSWNIIIEKI